MCGGFSIFRVAIFTKNKQTEKKDHRKGNENSTPIFPE